MTFKNFFYNKFFIIYFFPFILGSITFLNFKPYNYSILGFIIFPSYFYIINVVIKNFKSVYRKKNFFKYVFISSFIFWSSHSLFSIGWVTNSLNYDPQFLSYIWISKILFAIFFGIFFSIPILFISKYLDFSFISYLFFSGSIALIDFLKGKILTGFPWNLWAYSFVESLEFIQITRLIGIYAVNLLVISVSGVALFFFLKKHKTNWLIFLTTLLLFFSNYIYGNYELNQTNTGQKEFKIDQEDVLFKVVNPSFKINYIADDEELDKVLKYLIRLSSPDTTKRTVFIWPEGVFAGLTFDDLKKKKEIIKKNFSNKHLIIFGANTENIINDDLKIYNSLYVIDHDMKVLHRYDKEKLVPFGEFLPGENLLSKFGLKKITQGFQNFSSGSENKIFQFNSDLKILYLVCYELIFPELLQKQKEDYNLVINISEDAWFEGTIGPYQASAKAIFRAIESNSYIIRAANKGVSQVVDNKGRVLKSLQPNEVGSIETKVFIENNATKNKNDLIFFIILSTYLIIFILYKNKKL